jgi:hypothetical protein
MCACRVIASRTAEGFLTCLLLIQIMVDVEETTYRIPGMGLSRWHAALGLQSSFCSLCVGFVWKIIRAQRTSD